MIDRWKSLSDRERILIGIAVVLAVIFLVLQLIVSPIFGWRDAQRDGAARANSLYEMVLEASQKTQFQKADASGSSGSPPRTALSQTATASGVNLVYVNVRDDGSIEVNTDAVDPGLLFQWLSAVQQQHGVNIRTADISRESGARDLVKARLTFSGER